MLLTIAIPAHNNASYLKKAIYIAIDILTLTIDGRIGAENNI